MKAINKIIRELWAIRLFYKFKRLYDKNPSLAADALYYKKFKRHINLENPENLVEKIIWMSLNTDTSLWTLCADKYRMRSYVESKGLGDYLPQCYGFWENPDDIDFSRLPNQFVLKANNGCATVMIVRDKNKLDEKKVKHQMKKWLKRPFGYIGAEKHYLSIKPGILAEELLSQTEELNNVSPGSMVDFKIWCINGTPESVLVTYDRGNGSHKVALYDLDWNPTPHNLNEYKCEAQKRAPLFPRPKHLDKMIDIAKKISKDFKEARIDFYETDKGIILGEITLTAGYGSLSLEYYEYLGKKIDLSCFKNKNEQCS